MSRLQLSRKSCEATIRRVSLAIGFLPFLAAMTSPPAPPRVCFPVQSTTIGRALPVNAAALAANSPPAAARFVADSPLEGDGFELVWGFSCQVVVLGFAESSLFGAGKPFFIPSPAIRFPERAEGVKGPKR
jgi:hypothetical protein